MASLAPNTSRQETHEKKDVSKLTTSLHRIGQELRPTLPYKIILSRISDGEPVTDCKLKKIHLIRHGQGFHNVAQTEWRAAKKPGEPYWISTDPDFKYLDPELTPLGIQQATDLQTETLHLNPDLIIVSPMRRAIQTALLGFEKHIKSDGTCNESTSSTSTSTSTTDNTDATDTTTDNGSNKRSKISIESSSSIRILANENAHEIAGKHTCDKRLNKTELIKLYPMIDFSLIESESDPFWGNGEIRESHLSVSKRGASLMEEIRICKETNIVIAAHSTILFSLLNAVIHIEGNNDENNNYDISWFGTGEMRSFYVRWEEN